MQLLVVTCHTAASVMSVETENYLMLSFAAVTFCHLPMLADSARATAYNSASIDLL
jgi:hypothetical protein